MRPHTGIGVTAIFTALSLLAGMVVVMAGGQRGTTRAPGQPGFDTGTVALQVTNRPGVMVTNKPMVMARQNGPWVVSFADPEMGAGTALEFLQVGIPYRFTWPGGLLEEHIVRTVFKDGWVQVEQPAGTARSLNTSAVTTIDEITP